MSEQIKIVIDAMGVENAPLKNLEGIDLFLKKNKNSDVIFQVYGNKNTIEEILKKRELVQIKFKFIIAPQSYPMKKHH